MAPAQLRRHFSLLWAVFRCPELVPEDLKDTERALQENSVLRTHTTLLLCYIGLKYGPWRQALLASAGEVGLHGDVDRDEPRLTSQLLARILRATALRMDRVSLRAWGCNVGHGATHHSGGALWLKHLHILKKVPVEGEPAISVGTTGTHTISAPVCFARLSISGSCFLRLDPPCM